MDWSDSVIFQIIQTVFQIIQTAALIVAVFVACTSIKKQRETTKKDKTISLLMKDLEGDFLKDGMNVLLKIHNSEDDDDTLNDRLLAFNTAHFCVYTAIFYPIAGLFIRIHFVQLPNWAFFWIACIGEFNARWVSWQQTATLIVAVLVIVYIEFEKFTKILNG
jgi:hypothetical protein